MVCTDEPLQRRPSCPAAIQIVDGLFNGITYRTHSDDNMLCVWSTIVVEQLIVCTDLLVYLVHVLSERLPAEHRSMGCMLLLPGRRYPGSERNLSGMDDLGSMHAYGMRQPHPYPPYPSDLRNPMSRSSGSHEMYGNHRRS